MPEIHYPNQILPPIDQLLNLAKITPQDIETAIQSWEKKPPDPEFKLILRAEIDGT